jgi:L-fucose isomerase-like protein
MIATRLHLGLTGAVHPNMPGDDTGVFDTVRARLTELSTTMGFDLSVYPPPIRSEEDGRKSCSFMNDKEVDLTLLFNASLPFGRIILPFVGLKSRLALWSVPEPAKNGVLQLNSFCGTNMLGAIVGNYLTQHDIPIKWFYGLPDSPQVKERLKVTLRALLAVKTLRQARIAQIGGLANGFENLYVDERVFSKKFGTYLQTRYTVEEIVERARKIPKRDVDAETEVVRKEGVWDLATVGQEHMEKSIRVYIALREFARENGYDALAVSCWSRFQEVYGVAVCAALSWLNSHGIVAPCEGDVTSAAMMLALNAMNGGQAALNDLVAFDESDESLNLWHCGVAPASWADAAGVSWQSHFNIGRYRGEEWEGDGVVANLQFKAGVVTVSVLSNCFDNLFILSGEVMREKKGYAGSSGWVTDLRVNGNRVSVMELLNTIVVQRVNHHYPAAQGDLTNELNEFAAWLKIRVLEPVVYRPYLQLPVDISRPHIG